MARGKTSDTDTNADTTPKTRQGALLERLNAAKTSAELWKIAQADDFQSETQGLSDDEVQEMREHFKTLDAMLKGRVTAEEIADIPLVIEDWDFNTSPQFPDREFVVIKGVRQDNGKSFQLVSGAYKVKQFFTKLGVRTKDNSPQHITITAESASSMAQRNAKPNTGPMWLVKQASKDSARKRATGSPF